MHATRALVRSAVLLALTPLALVACATGSKPGFPMQSVDDLKQIEELEKRTDFITKLTEYNFASENKSARNQIINHRLVLMDLQYNRWVSNFASDKQTIDTVTDIIVLGLNLGATAVGGAGTKTLLSAISGGVVGSKLAIDKNVYYEKTVSALVAAMNAQRKAALVPILEGMRKDAEEYPLGRGLADLDSYYRAGTFLGALQAIQADAGVKEQQKNNEILRLRLTRVTKADVDEAEQLTKSIGDLNDEAKGKKALNALGVDTTAMDTLDKVKDGLQEEVRKATTSARRAEVKKVFTDEQILNE